MLYYDQAANTNTNISINGDIFKHVNWAILQLLVKRDIKMSERKGIAFVKFENINELETVI